MGADQLHVLPVGVEPGTEIAEGGDTGDGNYLVVPQQGPQLVGSAIKPGVSRQKHPDGALPLLVDILGDIRPGDEGHTGVALLKPLQQPGSPHQGGTLLDRLQRPQSHGLRGPHADANEIDFHPFASRSSRSFSPFKVSPVSRRGRSTTRRVQPAAFAASAFSRNPP